MARLRYLLRITGSSIAPSIRVSIYPWTVNNGVLIYTARSGALDLLINTLNGKIKKLKKLKEFADLDLLIEKGGETFTTSFFVEDLELPENLISDFIFLLCRRCWLF